MIWLLFFISLNIFASEELRDLKPFHAGIDWTRVTVVSIIFLLTLYFLLKKIFKKRVSEKNEKARTPIEEAIFQINELPLVDLKVETFKISMIIRRLIDSLNLKLNLSEKTTQEIKGTRLEISHLCGEKLMEELIQFLQACDEIKYKPNGQENPLRELKINALNIVEILNKRIKKDV